MREIYSNRNFEINPIRKYRCKLFEMSRLQISRCKGLEALTRVGDLACRSRLQGLG